MRIKRKTMKKNKGFILLGVMLIMSGLFLLVMGISLYVYSTRQLTATLEHNHQLQKVIANSVVIIRNILKNKKTSEEKESEGKEDNKKNNYEFEFFKTLWENLYKKKEFTCKEQYDGVEGKITLYCMVEDGKIPLMGIVQAIQEEQKKNKGNNKKEAAEKNDTNEKKEEGEEEKEQKAENSKITKEYKEFIKNLCDKSKNIKNIIYSTEGKDKESELEKIIGELVKKKNKIVPASLYECITKSKRDNKKLYKIPTEEDKTYGMGDLVTPYTENISVCYPSPLLLAGAQGKDFVLNDEGRKKIIDAGKNYFKSNKSNKPSEVWNELYTKTLQVPYFEKIQSMPGIEKLFIVEFLPHYISALVQAEYNNIEETVLLLFEKIALYKSQEDSVGDYTLKQIYTL